MAPSEFKFKGTLFLRIEGSDVDHELGDIEIPIRVSFDDKPTHFGGGAMRGDPGILPVKQSDSVDRSR